MPNIRRAWRDTGASLKDHGLPEVLVAALLFGGTYVASRQFPGLRADVGPLLDALIVTSALAALYLLVLFAHHWHLAGPKAELERLQPGPEQVAAEHDRVRQLRECVVLTQRDVNDLHSRLKAIEQNGQYWDRREPGLAMAWFVGSGAQLGGDARTRPAFEACDALRREMNALNELVRKAWWDDLEALGPVLEPDSLVHHPEVKEGDLDLIYKLNAEAQRALGNAITTLERP